MVPKKNIPPGGMVPKKTKGPFYIVVDLQKNINIPISFGTLVYECNLLSKAFRPRKPSPRTQNPEQKNFKTILRLSMSLRIGVG
jgi:hypothetical protein